jgi:hypothetical protein
MYRRSEREKQQGLWTSIETHLGEHSQKLYTDPNVWHNRFRKEITNRVDEDIFKVLYQENQGSPNAPIRILVAMLVLKEGLGVSDEHLYEEGRFNLQTRSALGLVNIDEEIPVESTYYLFRKKIVEYEEKSGRNLLEEAFTALTMEQCEEFHVSGKRLRMDSKLVGSNLSWYTRYEIVHETIQKYGKSLLREPMNLQIKEQKLFEDIKGEAGRNVSYRSSKEEVRDRMETAGRLMHSLLQEWKAEENPEYSLLKRVFEEQYVMESGRGGGKKKKLRVREKREMPAPSTMVTNPHDRDAEYRTKSGNTITGYSINICETCDEEGLNLIVDVQTAGAGTNDNRYVEISVESAREKVMCDVEELYTDGAYHSVENQKYCQKEGIDWTLRGISGKASKYDLSYNESGELIVYNIVTQQFIEAKRSKTKTPEAPKRWVIKDGEHAPLYFEDKDVVVSALRKKIASIDKEKLNIRNNVEATIFQLGYHYRGNKSRYRGLSKHRLWALSRCLWINFRRISAWVGRKEREFIVNAETSLKILRAFSQNPFVIQFA